MLDAIASIATRPLPPATPSSTTETRSTPNPAARTAPCNIPQAYGLRRPSSAILVSCSLIHEYRNPSAPGFGPKDLSFLSHRLNRRRARLVSDVVHIFRRSYWESQKRNVTRLQRSRITPPQSDLDFSFTRA